MSYIKNSDNKSTTTVNTNNVAPNANCDGKVKTNLDSETRIDSNSRTCVVSIQNGETQRCGIITPVNCDTRSNSSNRIQNCDSPRSSNNSVQKFNAPHNDVEKPTMYRCSACGVIQEGGDTPPKSCLKCDNEKFYRVK